MQQQPRVSAQVTPRSAQRFPLFDEACDPFTIVIFGATGDLAARKLLPALFNLMIEDALPDHFSIVGFARRPWSDDDFRNLALEAVPDGGPGWEAAVTRFRYVSGDYAHPDTFDELKRVLAELDEVVGTAGNRMYYLATIPAVFSEVAGALGVHGLNKPADDDSFVRLVVEKPFGRDLASATRLVRCCSRCARARRSPCPA